MICIVYIYSIDATQTSLLQLFVGVAEDIGCCLFFQRSKEDDYLCQFAIYRSEVVSWKIIIPMYFYWKINVGRIDCSNTSPRFELRAFPIHISAILLVSFSEDDVEVGLDDLQLNTVLTTDV